MKKFILLLLVCGLVFTGHNVAAQSEVNKDAVVQVAQDWLALADKGDFAGCWVDASALFQNAVVMGEFVQSMTAAREPMGQLVERKLVSAEYLTSLPGAPDGEYMVILFQTEFENKKVSIETITPMKDEDGIWRVSGYYIR